jgi:Fe-S cluster assembly protein SufD
MTTVTQLKTSAELALVQQFATNKAKLVGDASTHELREAAFGVIATGGLPNKRVEHWHYTDLRKEMRNVQPLADLPTQSQIAEAKLALAQYEGAKLVLLDGAFVPELSDVSGLPSGVKFTSMADVLGGSRPDLLQHLGALDVAKGDHALCLNASFMRDGVVLEVASNAQIDAPITLVSLRSKGLPASSSARSLIVVGAGAKFTLIEVHEGGAEADVQVNDVIEFVLGAGANVKHIVRQDMAKTTLYLATITANLGAKAEFNSFALVRGAGFSRRQLYVQYSGENAVAGLRGVSMLKGTQFADTTLVMDHAKANGISRELFKHVLDGDATGVYQGKVIVRQYAQKTDGGMKSNTLLLSDNATMNNKPELEIFADDVVCGHGATVGALDDELLFYLMARGLPKPEAERLMIQAFLGEAIEFVEHESMRDALNACVDTWLSER